MTRAVILLLIAVLAVIRGDDCVKRVVGPNAIVCVCNSTYCDSVSEVQVQENQYAWYTSTRSGQRLQSSIANFEDNKPMLCNIDLTVDSSQTFQTIFGFGGAMTDAAALNIRTLSNATQQNLLKSYYSAEGSRYIFCRIPIAGCDFSTRPYTYDDTPGDLTLSSFNLVEEDDYKIDYLHQIQSIMPKPDSLKIFTTAWSAPPWMKKSGNIKWGALKPEYYQLYADYILKFFNAYKERGIEIWGMTPGNEPLDGAIPFFTFNAMLWTPQTEAEFSTHFLAPTLSKAGYYPVYMALDDQRFEIPWYPDMVFKYSNETSEIFTGTAFHWYADKLFQPSRLDELHDMYPEKFLLMTEACAGSNPFEHEKVKLGSWERGEKYLSNIIENLSHWTCGWVDWNLALNKYGAPNWANNFVDSPIIVMSDNETDEFVKQPMYYAIQHVSKFVPPGSKRISCSCSKDSVLCADNSVLCSDDSQVKFIASLTPENKTVIVIMNKDDKPYNIKIQDKAMPDNMMYLPLPEKSFTTLTYQAPK